MVKAAVKGKVVVVAGGADTAFFIDTIVHALAVEGVRGVVQSSITDVGALPYAAQAVSKNADVVIAGGFLPASSAAQGASISNALLQAGLAGKPIIPALLTSSSLLEGKALLPDAAAAWAASVVTVLSVKESGLEPSAAAEVVLKEKPVLTAATSSADTLMEVLRESLKSHGASGIVGLSRKFRIVDDNNNGQIDIKEFSKAISEHALGWSAAQVKAVFDHFDKDKSGAISFDEFMQGVRGALNPRRRQLVLMAFEVLDADKSGVVEMNDIKAKYNASKHPDVIANKRTADEVLREFLDTFDPNADGRVTPDEFCQYYGNVSSSIDHDDYFELMIRNAWHISGGEGWCANSSCLRVLVVHADGHSSVEEIKNDMGIKGDDKDALLAKLTAQGVTDIDYIELSNGTKIKAHEPVAASPAKPAAHAAPVDNRAAVGCNPGRQPGGRSTFTLG